MRRPRWIPTYFIALTAPSLLVLALLLMSGCAAAGGYTQAATEAATEDGEGTSDE